MIGWLESLFGGKEPEKQEEAPVSGGIVPVIRCMKYNENIKPDPIKERLVKDMAQELLNYAEFTVKEEGNGVKLITARLDVLRRDRSE